MQTFVLCVGFFVVVSAIILGIFWLLGYRTADEVHEIPEYISIPIIFVVLLVVSILTLAKY